MRRYPVAQGRFYSDNLDELNSFFSEVFKGKHTSNSKIIIVPHAGYVFSGKTAAMGYLNLDLDFDTAIIIGTAHTMELSRPAVFSSGSFVNLYGEVEVDEDIAGILLESSSFEENSKAHIYEHSVEVQIPFLQYLKKDKFKIVPVVSNTENKKILAKAAEKLAWIVKNKKVVVVISSDLSHYPPYHIAKISDLALSKSISIAISNKDAGYFALTKELLSEKYSDYLDTVACGFSPMMLGLMCAVEYGYTGFKQVEYINSGDVYADKRQVVGYLSGYFNYEKEDEIIELSKEEKEELLLIARKSIEYYLKHNRIMDIEVYESPNFNLPYAVFVTLNKNGNLRGCIGSMLPHMLLGDAVKEYAVKAAVEDPRFPPVEYDELSDIEIEISVLSPLRKISDVSEIKENVHGVYVKYGFRSGTYLPQVWEHFKTRDEFLRSLFEDKSGIPYEHLNNPESEIYVYRVLSFKEN